MSQEKTVRSQRGLKKKAIAGAVLVLMGTSLAQAFEVDTGNEDLTVRLDTTLRYNLGVRTEAQDSRLTKFTTTDEGDAKFGNGDVVTNRLDVLGELDVNYKGRVGARLAVAGWYDNAYDNQQVSSPAGGVTSYFNNTYNGHIKRFVNGPAAEALDAFVWANFDLGDMPTNVKLGRHTVVWGEGMLIGAHAISAGQSPIDGVKAVSSPGIETKEVFLPINQLSFKIQATDKLSIAGQYALAWDATRVPFAGTYLGGADNVPYVDRFGVTPCNPALGAYSCLGMTNVTSKRPGETGNWGLSARLDVDSIEATLGAYYREFNDYNPETGIQLMSFMPVAAPFNAMLGPMLPTSYRFVFPGRTELLGFSLSKSVGPVSVGAEVSWRTNAHLNSVSSYVGKDTGAKGDTFHAVVNGTYLLPSTALWDTGSLVGELAYMRLNKITQNENMYRGVGYAGCTKTGVTPTTSGGDISDTCSTRDYWEMSVKFTPQYLGVMPSWDLFLPVSVGYGLKGTAATGGAGFEGLLKWSVGVQAVFASKHEFTLTYADLDVPTKYNAAGTAAIGGNALNSSVGLTDRGRLQFTYKTSF